MKTEKMGEEIPIWVNGTIQWVSGVDRKTTCKDVIEAVLLSEGNIHNVKEYAIMERWRRVERPLDENSKIFKIWSHWGDEKKEVRLCLKRISNEIDSGRGSPVGTGSTPSLKRRRHNRSRTNGKPPWNYQETLHPKRLAELELSKEDYEEYHTRKLRQCDILSGKSEPNSDNLIYDARHCGFGEKVYSRKLEDNGNLRKKSGHKSYQCAGTGVLHSTLLLSKEDDASKPTTSRCCAKKQSKSRLRNSENIEKLMKLILAQGATIQSQLQKLKQREEQIESLEHERHRERIEKNGRNYLLETYLGSLKEAEIPVSEEERGICSYDHSERRVPLLNSTFKDEGLDDLLVTSKGTHSSKQIDPIENAWDNESDKKNMLSRSRRSRSESRSVDHKCGDKESHLKRTLSDNALTDSSEIREISEGSAAETEESKEAMRDFLELQRIQSQVEMWEKVFKINKRLEKEEENLVRLHIKIKRFQTEKMKFTKEEGADDVKDEHSVEQDRKAVQKDLESLRENLDKNSKEIFQNYTRMRENEEVVEKKRSMLRRLINDLQETEHEHNVLSEMVLALPEERVGCDEERTSFSDKTNDEVTSVIIPTHPLSAPRLTKADSEKTPSAVTNFCRVKEMNIYFNQRLKNDVKPEENSDVKPKTVKITFNDQIQNSERTMRSRLEELRDQMSGAPSMRKGILKNRNCSGSGQYDCDVNQCSDQFEFSMSGRNEMIAQEKDMHEHLYEDKCQLPKGKADEIYELLPCSIASICSSPIYQSSYNCYRQTATPGECDAEKYVHADELKQGSNHGNEQSVYMKGNIMNTRTNIPNDTDSSTSSDTSGMCSMYSSSPTAEEPYAESNYVLDTLV